MEGLTWEIPIGSPRENKDLEDNTLAWIKDSRYLPRKQRRDFLNVQINRVFREYFVNVNVFVMAELGPRSYHFSGYIKGYAIFDKIDSYGDPVIVFLN